MNSGESLVMAVQVSGPRAEVRRKSASPERLLLVLVLVVLVSLTVILGVAPGGFEVATLDDPTLGALPNFERTVDDQINGAWSSAEADWFACNENLVPDLLCSAENFGATP
jgi:hypothetical protein